jgi:hypothetical protein
MDTVNCDQRHELAEWFAGMTTAVSVLHYDKYSCISYVKNKVFECRVKRKEELPRRILHVSRHMNDLGVPRNVRPWPDESECSFKQKMVIFNIY